MRTQDPSGAWGYQGNDPGSFKLVEQQEIRHSMGAGLGSLYICADRFQYRLAGYDANAGLTGRAQRVRKPGAPQVVKAVATAASIGTARPGGSIWAMVGGEDTRSIRRNINITTCTPSNVIRAFARSSATTPFQPATWYDDGVYILDRKMQETNGWAGQTGPTTDTAFSMLFLLCLEQKEHRESAPPRAGNLDYGTWTARRERRRAAHGPGMSEAAGRPGRAIAGRDRRPGPSRLSARSKGSRRKSKRPRRPKSGNRPHGLRALAGGDSPGARVAAIHTLGKARDIDTRR